MIYRLHPRERCRAALRSGPISNSVPLAERYGVATDCVERDHTTSRRATPLRKKRLQLTASLAEGEAALHLAVGSATGPIIAATDYMISSDRWPR